MNLGSMHFFDIVGEASNPNEIVLHVVQYENVSFIHEGPRNFGQLTDDWRALSFDRVKSWMVFIRNVLEAGCSSSWHDPDSIFKVGLEARRLGALNFTLLDGCTTQKVVQLYGFDSGHSGLILSCLGSQPEVDIAL